MSQIAQQIGNAVLNEAKDQATAAITSHAAQTSTALLSSGWVALLYIIIAIICAIMVYKIVRWLLKWGLILSFAAILLFAITKIIGG